MKHSKKVKIARKLLSKEELVNGTSKFTSHRWTVRRVMIEERVKRQQGRAHMRAILRKDEKTKNEKNRNSKELSTTE